MIQYTKDELNILAKELIHDPTKKVRYYVGYKITEIDKLNGHLALFFTRTLYLFLHRKKYTMNILGNIDNLSSIMYEIPFDELPLHINSSPKIVSWRLRIGK